MQIIVLSFPSALARTIQKLLNVETQRVQFKPLQLRFYTLIKASKLQKLMNIKDKQNNHFKSLKLGHSFNAAKLKRERDYRTPQDRRAGARSRQGQRRPHHRAPLWDPLCPPLCRAPAAPARTRSSPPTSPAAFLSPSLSLSQAMRET
jgi:hypothetical protein